MTMLQNCVSLPVIYSIFLSVTDDSKKFNNNSGESMSDTNRNSDSDNGDKNRGDSENNNYLMLQAKHRLNHSHPTIHSTQEEYIDLDKLYQSHHRTLLNSSYSPASSSHYQHNHQHLQHTINHPHHQNILAQQLSCLHRQQHPTDLGIRGQGHGNPHQGHPQGRIPLQGHPQGRIPPPGHPGSSSQGHRSSQLHHLHPPASVSSSTSPTSLSIPSPHLNSDHNHRRNHLGHHQHLPQQLPHAHAQQTTSALSINTSHHSYNNYPPSVFNGGTGTHPVGSQSQGRDGYGQSSAGNEPNDYSSYAQQQYPNYNEDPDSDSESDHQRDIEAQPIKKRPGRPRGSRRKKPEKLGRLWEFIRDLLLNSETCPSLICWDNYEEGMFRFVHSDKVAKLWGAKRDNPDMNYEKLSRAMRYYYKSKVLQPVFGRRLVYKFGPEAKGWKTDNPNFRC
ncbi:ecdysone-induced protein 74EF isoform X2 [Nilaparvata lugens]|uniref:ecdysone-induced protein 74EF isoform X2 n=1 Tax=Nilaparvata lugens TaxID=108931 RepID=UPI00193DBD98|nr:ecdysone-induced protein 74EF isoform X2 [Nilaparvata lugens]